ncbi:hypothetical protein ACFUCQ_34280, partial [Streptomyces sp. NPDC057197]
PRPRRADHRRRPADGRSHRSALRQPDPRQPDPGGRTPDPAAQAAGPQPVRPSATRPSAGPADVPPDRQST